MQNKIAFLSDQLILRVIEEAHQLLTNPGVKVINDEARQLLSSAGAIVNQETFVVKIPSDLILKCLSTVPSHFHLYDANGLPKVHYGGNAVHFDPGSSGINVLDPETMQHRESVSGDLIKIIKVVEGISQYDAQSTSVFCADVPTAIQDLYRLYLVLLFSEKPIVTGALSNKNIQNMIDMLAIVSGGHENLRRYPRAVFDVCPSPPLVWSNFGGGNLIALARAGVPAEMVSVPLAGAAAPVTLIGTVTQHTAECLAGMVIHQLAQPGSPLVWGGAPTIFEMRKGGAPMGTVETAMLDSACSQVGKSLKFPTHGYLGGSDSKLVDAQAGLENGIASLAGVLSGINMISGAGMIDSLLCVSPEKLVLDAESIAMARRFARGIDTPTETLATAFYQGVDFKGGDFLKQRITINLFRTQQYLTGPVIDRDSMRDWLASGSRDSFGRAVLEVDKLVKCYKQPFMNPKTQSILTQFVEKLAKEAGLESLPVI